MINEARHRVLRGWRDHLGDRIDDHFGDCQRSFIDIRRGSYDQIAKQYSCSCVHANHMMDLDGLKINF